LFWLEKGLGNGGKSSEVMQREEGTVRGYSLATHDIHVGVILPTFTICLAIAGPLEVSRWNWPLSTEPLSGMSYIVIQLRGVGSTENVLQSPYSGDTRHRFRSADDFGVAY
jgi:hypothetical protein